MKFLVRGDCTSRRMLMLNRARFSTSFSLVTNEKAPNVVFCDHLDGIRANPQVAAEFVDETRMGKSQLLYFRRQFERNVLTEKNASLLVIDPYSEMNFQLWKHRSEGWRFWTPKHAIIDMVGFSAVFESEGYRTLDQSLHDTARVVRHIRANNPEMPVLFLPQLLNLYPALAHRAQFNELGSLLRDLIPGLHVGMTLLESDLVPDDLGTGGGPGLTLHFSGDTYWRCAAPALAEGLVARVEARNRELLRTQVPTLDLPAENQTISLQRRSQTCNDGCETIVRTVKTNLQEYFIVQDPEIERTKQLRYRTGIIDLGKYRDFAELESYIKRSGKGNRIRLRNKAKRMGFYCKAFHWRMHIPDIHAVNTSTDIRSGGAMRPSSQKSIEEMGGAPTKTYKVVKPKCSRHWSQPWGVFMASEGYQQGNQTPNERLYGYIFLRRFGECLVYSLIMGHYDYLNDGIMSLLHHEVMRWVMDSDDEEAEGIKVVMYGGYDQGTQGLRDWKRREGFEPFIITVTD